MAHVPHLLVPGAWAEPVLPLDDVASRHLRTVLRRTDGDELSYTDGEGRTGIGVLEGDGVRRGVERFVEPPGGPAIAVAAPHNKDRVRFLVEKLAELGVVRLIWLRTSYGQGRPPATDKVASWARAALEQSRSAWLLVADPVPVGIHQLPSGSVFADADGDPVVSLRGVPCVAIGPEGGWAPDEVPEGAMRVSLGSFVLRVETAAIAAAVRATIDSRPL